MCRFSVLPAPGKPLRGEPRERNIDDDRRLAKPAILWIVVVPIEVLTLPTDPRRYRLATPQSACLSHQPGANAGQPRPLPKEHRLTSPPRRPTDKLTVDEFCDDLRISRSTFYDWRKKGTAPRCIRIPNGALRIRRSDYENWLTDCEDHA